MVYVKLNFVPIFPTHFFGIRTKAHELTVQVPSTMPESPKLFKVKLNDARKLNSLHWSNYSLLRWYFANLNEATCGSNRRRLINIIFILLSISALNLVTMTQHIFILAFVTASLVQMTYSQYLIPQIPDYRNPLPPHNCPGIIFIKSS